MRESILRHKRMLAVDDEPDILDTLKEQLEEFEGLVFDKATDYETGYHLLRSWTYDLVILDIMGVRGFDLLRDKGVMLYSTCTYNPEENEEVIQYLLENRDARILPIELNFPHENGLTNWKENIYERELEKTARFYPHYTNSTGFFMARIGRKKG